jgi:hypothetical protein
MYPTMLSVVQLQNVLANAMTPTRMIRTGCLVQRGEVEINSSTQNVALKRVQSADKDVHAIDDEQGEGCFRFAEEGCRSWS